MYFSLISKVILQFNVDSTNKSTFSLNIELENDKRVVET